MGMSPEHIDSMCAKANGTLGFLKRNLKISSQKIKEAAYNIYVRPILEYASSVWDPHTQQNIDRIEAIQRRAARFVKNRYRNTSSVSKMLEDMKWPPLQNRRRIARLAMLYHIHHDLVSVNAIRSKLLPLPPRKRRGHDKQFNIPQCRTQYQQYSFLPRTIRDWNELPESTVQAETIDTFMSGASEKNFRLR